ncbi:hypothetical protein [uncultured Paludibaculum sp.]|uniref:CTP synthase C-terminal region-related (seleno)protein n=1 Tax=uncultured Paludibaculum sp. TaxID=1765020 RepID=UPI002AAB49A2|nr:hypothetical protein [uncultured Paludibaculum sp.]
METVTIGIIGDFDPGSETHRATNDGLRHAGEALQLNVQAVWLPTDGQQSFDGYAGLFCAPGSPYKSLDGALAGIRHARENDVPFLGTCGGFQHLVIEYARNVMGLREASHAGSDPYASCLFVTRLSCSLVGQSMEVSITPGSRAAKVLGSETTTEAYYCNFGLNPEYQQALAVAGLRISGVDQEGAARIVELPGHRYFLGTLFVPQARSKPGAPHPMVVELCRAAADKAR